MEKGKEKYILCLMKQNIFLLGVTGFINMFYYSLFEGNHCQHPIVENYYFPKWTKEKYYSCFFKGAVKENVLFPFYE